MTKLSAELKQWATTSHINYEGASAQELRRLRALVNIRR